MKKLLGLALVASLSACGIIDFGEVVKTDNVKMIVVANKGSTKRFWVTLSEKDGTVWNKVRFSGKRCSDGVDNLPVGKFISAKVNIHRYKDGRVERQIDTNDLDRQFC